MAIFISHTTADDYLAQKVYRHLTETHNIKCYIDDMDKELAKMRGKSSITKLLVERLRKCDTLLAVVTENTKNSWWVPFEIGTAREMPKIISSFTSLAENSKYNYQEVLPEYLLEWPRLRKNSDLDTFAANYKRNGMILESVGQESFSRTASTLTDVRKFELSIMDQLGQKRF